MGLVTNIRITKMIACNTSSTLKVCICPNLSEMPPQVNRPNPLNMELMAISVAPEAAKLATMSALVKSVPDGICSFIKSCNSGD